MLTRLSLLHRLLTAVAAAALVVRCAANPAQPTSLDVLPSPGSTATPTDGTQAPTLAPSTFVAPDPNAAFDPVALAEAVVNAESDAVRQQAIVNALAAIGVGIYTAEGEPIVSGAERTSTDFVVYDFEVAALSGGIADGDEVFLDDVAHELSVMNVSAGGAPFTAAEFATSVTAATAQAMVSPDQPTGYALRLARELAMRQTAPVDLAAAPGDQQIVIDPLSGFLVAADVSLPKILAAEPPAVATTGQVASMGGVGAITAADPCTKFRRQMGTNWHAGMTPVPGTTGDNASFSKSLQARLLGGTVKFGSSHPASWHHVHKHELAPLGSYQIGLQVRVQVPQRIDCGPIRFDSSGQMQGGGPIAGAEVTWTHPGLEDHAEVTCAPIRCQRTTSEGFALLDAVPKFELGPGGIGPEFGEQVTVTAEVDLFRALGVDLWGKLNLPPDMKVLGRKEMRTDITWHRAFEFQVSIDSQLYVSKAPASEYANHVGTATLSGVLDADTVHRPDDVPDLPPKIGTLVTVSDQGQGPLCSPGIGGAQGSITIQQSNGEIDFQVIELVVDPASFSLYMDVGPGDDSRDDTYRLVQCNRGVVVVNTTSPGTNLWETIIFRGYPRGLSFSGLLGQDGGPTPDTQEGVWNLRASDLDWGGQSAFVVAVWETPQDCGGYCDPAKSWLNMSILAHPLPDP